MSGSFSTVGTITAQTLVVQTVTSSVDFVTGSTRFGTLLTNTHVFTGSMAISGGLVVSSTTPELTVGATGVTLGNVITDAHTITGSVNISGSLSGSSAAFSGGATFFNGGNTFIFSQNVLTSGNADGAHIRNVISTAANPTYAWSGDTDTGMYSDAANTIGFSTSGSNRFTIASTGAATFSGSVTNSGLIFNTNDAVFSTSGSITRHATVGLVLRGATAAVFDFAIYSANGTALMTNQTGTNNINFNSGTVTAQGVRSVNSGVDSVFQDAFVGVYSSNNNEQNAIQASVSSTAQNSGFRFQASNGGGSTGRTTVADFLRDRQIFYHNVLPASNGTQDLGSSSLRWGTVFTSDLDMSNGIGDYTIVEGEEDLFLYNNKTNKVFKFLIQEVDPSEATPKMKK
jgi:hypothetical protein